MKADFADGRLDRLETDVAFDAGYSPSVVSAFRRRMQQIRSAPDERVFYALKSLHFEKLKGARSGERSMRLNDQWRLIVEITGAGEEKAVLILRIEDYH
jgi:proteic killer suppression protein